MSGAINWIDVRYRGDAADVEELLQVHRIGYFLDTFGETLRGRYSARRADYLCRGIRLTEQTSPRVHRILHDVLNRLLLQIDIEVFCLPEQNVNAAVMMEAEGQAHHCVVALTAGALEKLGDDEIASIIGHEVGHFLFRHHRFSALVNQDEDRRGVTVLPPLAENLFLRWRKKSEISADRAGLLACRDLHAAARGLLKAAYGLGSQNITLEIDDLLSQIDDLQGKPELMVSAFASHPLLPLRLKAMQMFSVSDKARRNGMPVTAEAPLSDDALEDGVDGLVNLTKRSPKDPLWRAVMYAVAAGGALVLAADENINDYELKVLIEVLHRWFTDEPETIVLVDREENESQLSVAIALINDKGSHEDKTFILSRLAEIAIADGALMGEEGCLILEIAERLQVPATTAYRIMFERAREIGFKVDVKLNRVARELRHLLETGLGCPSQ